MPDSIVADGDLIAPRDSFSVALFITVRDVAASRTFYAERLGGRVVRDANPCIIRLSNAMLIMNPGGGPTPDKPNITLAPYGRRHRFELHEPARGRHPGPLRRLEGTGS